MGRLGLLDAPEVARSTWVLVAVFAVGMGALLSLSPVGRDGLPQLDANMMSILYLAIAFAAYLVQRRPYIKWRLHNRESRLGSWLRALGIALLYQVAAVLAAVPAYIAFAAFTGR